MNQAIELGYSRIRGKLKWHLRIVAVNPTGKASLIDWWPIAVSAVCAGILVPLAIRARSIGHDEPGGVQKLHRVPTSRLGGLIDTGRWCGFAESVRGVGRRRRNSEGTR